MKQPVSFRIIVDEPLAGVKMIVQRGRNEFLPASRSASTKELRFEFEINIDLTGANPNFLGKYAQGPKDARFVYVNSGRQAGQMDTCWDRRAKLSLMSIRREQVKQAIKEDAVIETRFPGIGRDGGPTCASVKGLEWRVVKK